MTTWQSCPWCGRFNHVFPQHCTTCTGCGHRADRPRLFCDCVKCRPGVDINQLTDEDGDEAARFLDERGGQRDGITAN